MNTEQIGAFICQIRKEKCLTQEQLAEKVGVSQRTVSRWETGSNLPDYSFIIPICRVLNISVNEFINGKRDENRIAINEKNDISTNKRTACFSNKEFNNNFFKLISILIIIIATIILSYTSEFCVKTDSTVDLEQAIDCFSYKEKLDYYPVHSKIEKRIAFKNRLYVLYTQEEDEKFCGIAVLEKGLLSGYRFVKSENTTFPLVNLLIDNNDSCFVYCVNRFDGADSVEIIHNDDLIKRINIDKLPILELIQHDYKNVYPTLKYFDNGKEVSEQNLININNNQEEKNFNDGVTADSIIMFYVWELILLFFAFVIIRKIIKSLKGKRND